MQSPLRLVPLKITRNCGACVLLFAAMLVACSDGPSRGTSNAAAKRPTPAATTRTTEPYRIRADLQRKRYWALNDDQVSVYDAVNRKLIRHIPLPGRNVADFVADPDMVLDPTGVALVSSNITPTLWRIDPGNFTVTRIDIKLKSRENWDTGFSALAYAADGTLFGMTAFGSSLWLLNIAEATATPIELANPASVSTPVTTPTSTPQSLRVAYQAAPTAPAIEPYLCIASADRLIRVNLSADNRRGRIVDVACNSD